MSYAPKATAEKLRETIVVLGGQPEYLSGLRGPMIRDFIRRGYEVVAIGAEEHADVRAVLEGWGARYLVVPMRRTGLNPFSDLALLIGLYRTLRRLNPDIFFGYTLKPVAYGLLAARLAGIKQRYGLIAGRGYPFLPGPGFKRKVSRVVATALYRVSLRSASGVIFQNEDDRDFFRRSLMSINTPHVRVFGSGVELDRHRAAPLPPGPLVFLLVGRLVAHKGVFDFIEAARILKPAYPLVSFRVLGPTDPSPNGLSNAAVEQLQREAVVEYLGSTDDVRPIIAESHVFVLPSHGGEGVPRSILEAMAAGRPIITTSTPGCSDTVVAGANGYLVPPHNPLALAEAMRSLIENPDRVEQMGVASLDLARRQFDVVNVNKGIAEFIGLSS